MNKVLDFYEAKELNHKYLGEKNLEKKKVLKDKLIIGTIPHIKKIIDNNYKNYHLSLYDINDLYNTSYELWIRLINQDILYQVKSFDDIKITKFILDRLPGKLAINNLSFEIQDNKLITDLIYNYVNNNSIFDEKEFQKLFRELIHQEYNETIEDENKIFNYFYNRNYQTIKEVTINYLNNKNKITKLEIERTIDVLALNSIDNSSLNYLAVKDKSIDDLFKEKDNTVKEIMSGLTPLEREIITKRFDLDDGGVRTLLDISKEYDEDYDFINKVYNSAVNKMKAFYYCKYGCVDKNKGR